jgi:hypothetical protein
LISNPADLKGLHETLQKASHSTGDKEVMAMTIEDIQNILKNEFRRRASQTASVEIWKALLVVGGLLFVLYWGRIGQDIAGETARVTTLTLEDEQLQAKAFELANVIVRIRHQIFSLSSLEISYLCISGQQRAHESECRRSSCCISSNCRRQLGCKTRNPKCSLANNAKHASSVDIARKHSDFDQ